MSPYRAPSPPPPETVPAWLVIAEMHAGYARDAESRARRLRRHMSGQLAARPSDRTAAEQWMRAVVALLRWARDR